MGVGTQTFTIRLPINGTTERCRRMKQLARTAANRSTLPQDMLVMTIQLVLAHCAACYVGNLRSLCAQRARGFNHDRLTPDYAAVVSVYAHAHHGWAGLSVGSTRGGARQVRNLVTGQASRSPGRPSRGDQWTDLQGLTSPVRTKPSQDAREGGRALSPATHEKELLEQTIAAPCVALAERTLSMAKPVACARSHRSHDRCRSSPVPRAVTSWRSIRERRCWRHGLGEPIERVLTKSIPGSPVGGRE